MKRPCVSIVIPVYNGANYLAQAIDSALAQTYPNCDVVVVNDGSTDGGATEAIARSYGDRVRYFHKSNGHVASALNFGIRHMNGEYFSWLSHDDLYHADKVAAQIEFLGAMAPHTVVYSDFEVLDTASGTLRPARLPHTDPAHFRSFITLNNALHGCTLLIPKRCLELCGPFDETLRTTQDYDMWFRLAGRCRFAHLPRVLVTSRHHAEQGSHQLRDVAVAECDRLLTGFVRDLSSVEIAAATGSSLSRSYASMAANLAARGFAEAGRAANALSRAALQREPPLARLIDSTYVLWHRRVGPVLSRSRQSLSKLKQMLAALVRMVERLFSPGQSAKQKFSDIYRHNVFGGVESRSGGGSSLEQTAAIRAAIPALLRELGVKTMIDAPCGDFFWMQHTELGVDRYIGIDIVEELIARDQQQFGSGSRQFLCLNIIDDMVPPADLIFSRDCLVHLNFDQATKALRNFQRSGAKYLLTTTFTDRAHNVDLVGNDIWRTLNLERAPFNLPKPLRLINERCTEGDGGYADKSLGLWALQNLNLR